MSAEKLPEFKGRLAPAPWSGIKLNAELEGHLAVAALKTCAGCLGKGWHGKKPVVEICHCVNRPLGRI